MNVDFMKMRKREKYQPFTEDILDAEYHSVTRRALLWASPKKAFDGLYLR